MLSKDEKGEIEAEAARYETRQAAAIDAMRIVQRRRGWVSDEAIAELAAFLQMPAAQLDSVASFYNQIFRRPVGRHVIQICDSVSCWLTGCEPLRDHLARELGVGLGGTTADGRFTLLPVACLGACDQAPAMLVDEDLHTGLDAGSIGAILDRYR
ncbi:MAG: NADH-quinone oxidoreductase subunit NuoE [Thermoleophilia bacterium]